MSLYEDFMAMRDSYMGQNAYVTNKDVFDSLEALYGWRETTKAYRKPNAYDGHTIAVPPPVKRPETKLGQSVLWMGGRAEPINKEPQDGVKLSVSGEQPLLSDYKPRPWENAPLPIDHPSNIIPAAVLNKAENEQVTEWPYWNPQQKVWVCSDSTKWRHEHVAKAIEYQLTEQARANHQREYDGSGDC